MRKIREWSSKEIREAVLANAPQFHIIRDVSVCQKWRLDPQYPISKFIDHPIGYVAENTAKDWIGWLKEEREDDENYYRELEAAWLHDPWAVGPVVVAELPNNTMDIADGWHRIAISVLHNIKKIPAIVGVRCKT